MTECLENTTAAGLGVCELPLGKRDCVVNNNCCGLALPDSGGKRFWHDRVTDWIDSKLQLNGTCDFSHLITCELEPIVVCSYPQGVCPW